MHKYRALDGKEMDSLRLPCNFIWPHIQAHVYKSFGSLATMVWGELQNDDILLENYIKTFNIEKDMAEIREDLQKHGYYKSDRAFMSFAQSQKHYYQINVLKSYDDFHIKEWVEAGKGTIIVLLGSRGNGKSTFISYLMKNLPEDIIVFTDNLAYVKEESEVNVEIYQSLIKQIDQKVTEVGTECGLSERDILNSRFKDELLSIDALISTNDAEYVKIEKERRRSDVIIEQSKFKTKFSRDCLLYLRTGTKFLKSMKKQLCVIFDDVDRISNLRTAEKIRLEVQEIKDALDIPVIVSLREITARKMGDRFDDAKKYHLLAPTFEDVVERRFITFEKLLKKEPPEPITFHDHEYRVEDFIKFARNIIDSVVSKKENLWMFYGLSNWNLDLMLDYLKCLFASSHYTNEDVQKIIAGEKISQHKILETLLLYIYREIDKENSFLINLYTVEENEPQDTLNNLFRLRALQVIREFGSVGKENRKSLQFGGLSFYLEQLGYGDLVEAQLKDLIKMLVEFSIVETSIFGHNYRDDTEIILFDSAYYYLDFLIYTYRYIQTILPDTRLDYQVNMAALHDELKFIDEEIVRFIDFIKKCENEELQFVKDKEVFRRIISMGKISEKIIGGFRKDKDRQMKVTI